MALLGRRLRLERSGQALTEFAIVAPLLVIVLLFAMWLWEIVQIKLKLQEAARYAAWQTTTFQLHSYMDDFYMQWKSFSAASLGVSGEATGRFTDLDSRTVTGQVGSLLLSRWQAPKIVIPPAAGDVMNMISGTNLLKMVGYPVLDTSTDVGGESISGNNLEELLPGGQLTNSMANIMGPVLSFAQSASYVARVGGWPNAVATALIGLNRSDAYAEAGSGLGGAARLMGSPTWGFNGRGYIKAFASINVINAWIGVRVFGQPLFPRPIIELKEQFGLLADAWDLNQPDSIDNYTTVQAKGAGSGGLWGMAKTAGSWLLGAFTTFLNAAGTAPSSPGGYHEQLERMYFMHPKAKSVAKAFMRMLVEDVRVAAMQVGATLPADWLKEDAYFYPSLVSQAYTVTEQGKAKPGLVGFDEDGMGGRVTDAKTKKASLKHAVYYNTAPLIGEYTKTLEQRGPYFMGCPEAEQLSCQRGLAQANPFADYLYRE